jgi:hypothetical protein
VKETKQGLYYLTNNLVWQAITEEGLKSLTPGQVSTDVELYNIQPNDVTATFWSYNYSNLDAVNDATLRLSGLSKENTYRLLTFQGGVPDLEHAISFQPQDDSVSDAPHENFDVNFDIYDYKEGTNEFNAFNANGYKATSNMAKYMVWMRIVAVVVVGLGLAAFAFRKVLK